MPMELSEVFAVEIDGEHYHYQCTPYDHRLHKDDIILNGDEERDVIYFCGECGEQIT